MKVIKNVNKLLKKAKKDPKFRKELIASLSKKADVRTYRAIASELEYDDFLLWDGREWGKNPKYRSVEENLHLDIIKEDWERELQSNDRYYLRFRMNPRIPDLSKIYFRNKEELIEALKNLKNNIHNTIVRVQSKIDV